MLHECYWCVRILTARKRLGNTQINVSIYVMQEACGTYQDCCQCIYASYWLENIWRMNIFMGKICSAVCTSQCYNIWWENKHFNNEYNRWWKLPNLQISILNSERIKWQVCLEENQLIHKNLLYHHCEKKQLEVAWNDDSKQNIPIPK